MVKGIGTYWQVYHDEQPVTIGGLKKEDLVMIDTKVRIWVEHKDKEMITSKTWKKQGNYSKLVLYTRPKHSPELVDKDGKMVVSKKEFEEIEILKQAEEELKIKNKKKKDKQKKVYKLSQNKKYIRPRIRC